MRFWQEIEVARNRIGKVILKTPMIYSDAISKITEKEVFLKLENLQKTGSSKKDFHKPEGLSVSKFS
jgi:threonine dehydratase